MKLYHYWRSSAAYRVRIGLNLKGLTVEHVPVDLRAGDQGSPAYRRVNPAGLVPALDLEPSLVRQSLAILEYLEETQPTPALLPPDPLERARVRALCQDIACDIHPINNLRVLNRLREQFQAGDAEVAAWYRHWVAIGLESLEEEASHWSSDTWLYRNQLTLADVCLIPQLYNATRFDMDLTAYPRLKRVYDHAREHDAFARAAPERHQGDQ